MKRKHRHKGSQGNAGAAGNRICCRNIAELVGVEQCYVVKAVECGRCEDWNRTLPVEAVSCDYDDGEREQHHVDAHGAQPENRQIAGYLLGEEVPAGMGYCG